MRHLKVVHQQQIALFQRQEDFLLVNHVDELVEELAGYRGLVSVDAGKVCCRWESVGGRVLGRYFGKRGQKGV